MRRLLVAAWKAFVATLLCANPVTAILVVGWVQRAMRRRIVLQWHHKSGAAERGFREFAAGEPQTAALVDWPNFVLGPAPRASLSARLASLGANAREGVAAVFNTWVLTLPACALWLFAWYDGWNNSFTKGYEQAAVGPATGLFGVALFIAAMLYVPMAQARQAATGRWRSFYDFSLVWGLTRRRWWSCVKLAGLYALVSVPVMVLKTAPLLFDRAPGYPALSDAEALEVLQGYFFWAGALVFAAYLLLRLAAARVYADAVLQSVRSGYVLPDRLSVEERAVLDRLGLLGVEERPARHAVVRAVGGLGRLTTRTASIAVLVSIWFAFVAQIFVSEFFNYHPIVGWLNQPLVQLPWVRYIPAALTG